MTSLFDTNVYRRRNHTPWARISLVSVMRDLALQSRESEPVIFSVNYRHSVASRFWWTIEWTRHDGEKYSASAQELDLCLWRAAEIELHQQKKDDGEGAVEAIDCGAECAQCGFRYQAHNGHIIPCPVCRLAELEVKLTSSPSTGESRGEAE